MKVFVVTEGEYSDFDINSMWSTREKAQAYIDKRLPFKSYGGINEGIEEWELDSVDVGKQVVYTTVRMSKDFKLVGGDSYNKPIEQEDVVSPPDMDYKREGFGWYDEPYIHTGPAFMDYHKDPNPDHATLVWTVKTADKERAIKVVSEVVAQIIAAGIWGDESRTKEAFGK